MTLIDHYRLSFFLTAAITTIFGIGVFAHSPHSRIARNFCVYALNIPLWTLLQAAASYSHDPTSSLMWIRAMFYPVLIFPVLLIHFFSAFLRVDQRWVCRAGWTLAAAFAPFVASNTFLQASGPIGFLPFMPKAGPLFLPFNIVWFGWVVYGFWLLAKGPQGGCQPTRQQVNFLLTTFIFGYVVACSNYLYFYRWYILIVHPFANYGVPIVFLAIAYGVFAFNLFDINVVIRRSLVYSILVTLLTTSYFALVYAVERIFQTTLGYQSTTISLGAFAIMALIFQPMKVWIQRFVDLILFRTPQEALAKRVERLEHEAAQTEKLKAVATLAAGMAHEIKNPLASIKTFAEHLPHNYEDPVFREKFARIISQEVGKINQLVQDLLEFAKPTPPQRRPTRLSSVIDETVELLHGPLMEKRVEVAKAYTLGDTVAIDPAQMKQVFLNLLLNSIEAMARPGCITVSTVAENSYLEVLLADSGPGIAPKDLPHVFDPFFTTKRHGTGLGLAIVHGIVREHGGRITLDSQVGRGTTVRIRLPLNGGANGASAHSDRG